MPDDPTHDKQTGHYKYDPDDYAAVQKPRNPDYYQPVGAGGAHPTVVSGTSQYDQREVNNGQRTHANTHSTTESTDTLRPGITAHYNNGYEQDTATWKATDGNIASNYAMTNGAAAMYNGGVHVAQGMNNADYIAKFHHTKYSVLGADYRL